MFYIIIMLFVSVYFLFVISSYLSRPRSLDRRHVVITGGSSGIGECVAILCAHQGANVTVIARDWERLTKAKEKIKKSCIYPNQHVNIISVNVSNREDVHRELLKSEHDIGPIYMLVNCAGVAICGKVEDFTETTVKRLIDVNYLGTLYPIQTVVPLMKKRKEGVIVLTSSQAGLMGIFGYSVYASVKFALRGLAESIHMELIPYDVSVTLCLPPDTDTPGYLVENESKPPETRLISEAASLWKPEVVAKTLLDDALRGKFLSYVGFESAIVSILCVGMSPFVTWPEVIFQSILLGPLRLIGAFFITHFRNLILKCHDEQKEDKQPHQLEQ